MTYAPPSRLAIGLSALSLVALSFGSLGCASSSSSGGTGGNAATGTGGSSSGTGGSSSGTGGSTSGTGGSVGTGGSGTGGSVATGGTPGTGGSVSTGGAPGTGGNGTGGATGGLTGSGGSAGKGGASGSTGTGGSAGKGGSTGTGGAAGAGATTFYTDDFESDMAGKQPAGWDNFIGYIYKTTNPSGNGSSALADATHTHNGSKLAAHFKISGSDPVFLQHALPTGTNHLYLRVFVYLTNAMGDLPMSGGDNHETLLGLTGDPTSANTQIRFGQIKGVIGTNQVPTDNIAPIMAQWYSGPVISSGTWHCLEVEFDGSATYNTLRAYSDGTLIHSIAAGSDWQNGALPGTWMNGMFVDVLIGWQSFSSLGNENLDGQSRPQQHRPYRLQLGPATSGEEQRNRLGERVSRPL